MKRTSGFRASPRLALAMLAMLLLGCSRSQTLQSLFPRAATPHEAYARSLRRSGLDRTALGQAWLRAADRALRDSLVVRLPFAETGYFRADEPTAAAWRYAVREGEAIEVNLTLAAGTPARVFLDAFELPLDLADPKPLASADTVTLVLRYVAEADRQHLLRLQPELLAAGRYTVRIRRAPSLGFPVSGRTDAAVGSGWGADRDNGGRRHEGIDIFAPKGTPVVAAAPGFVTRVDETPRGGRVVWLADTEGGQHLYYAHLDRQLVQAGQRVRPGDTLGLMGNTGNAITTPPHLHFGVYRAGGAVDPLPFVRRPDPEPAVAADGLAPGTWARVKVKSAVLTRAELVGAKNAVGPTLPKHAALRVLGRQAGAYRVELPDGRRGYVGVKAVEEAERQPLRRTAVAGAAGRELLASPRADAAPVAALTAGEQVAVLAEAADWLLVRTSAGRLGWLAAT